jgi:hypothetical protein
LFYTTGRKPVSDWNRPVRTRMPGGVGPVAGLTVSHGDPIRLFDSSLAQVFKFIFSTQLFGIRQNHVA